MPRFKATWIERNTYQDTFDADDKAEARRRVEMQPGTIGEIETRRVTYVHIKEVDDDE